MAYNLKVNFGKKLREYRYRYDPIITQEELADRLGMRQAHISAIETGARDDVKLSTVLRFLNELKVKFDEFWEDK